MNFLKTLLSYVAETMLSTGTNFAIWVLQFQNYEA